MIYEASESTPQERFQDERRAVWIRANSLKLLELVVLLYNRTGLFGGVK
jgi:hypothetical protein